jgi:hypothetical protein
MKIKVNLDTYDNQIEGTIELVDQGELNDTSLYYLLRNCEGIGDTTIQRLTQFFKDNRVKLIEYARID